MVAVKELSAVVAVAAEETEFSVLLRLRGPANDDDAGSPPPASSSNTAADLDSWDVPPHDREKGSVLVELEAVAAAVPLWT